LNILWILKKLFTLGDEFSDNCPSCLQLVERLLLPFNQFFNIFYTARSNVSCRAQHDSIKELNVRLQLITISITFPVKIYFDLKFMVLLNPEPIKISIRFRDLSLQNSGNEFYMLIYHSIKF